MSDPGFMIPLNLRDFLFPFEGGTRDICSPSNQATYTQAPWWTCENIQLTTGGSAVPSAVVGTAYVIQVGIEGLPAQGGYDTPAAIQNVEAWVCYPNTVAGGASATLVVPSMQNNNFASFSNVTPSAPIVFWDSITGDYQNPKEGGFALISLSSWTPTEEDFLEQSTLGGHCCIIANAAGQASLEDVSDPDSGEPVGVVITDNSQLAADFDICQSIYQAQRNIVIVPAPKGMMRIGFAFLSGAPNHLTDSRASIMVTAIKQGSRVDPVLLRALSSGPYTGLPLKPASTPPKSMKLTRHDHKGHSWLEKIVREAEEIIEDLIGLAESPFGGGQRLHLHLPPKGLQPLRADVELEGSEAPGTVHAIDITQINADGARGGIRMGVVVT
jgi:hypothetical protein